MFPSDCNKMHIICVWQCTAMLNMQVTKNFAFTLVHFVDLH